MVHALTLDAAADRRRQVEVLEVPLSARCEAVPPTQPLCRRSPRVSSWGVLAVVAGKVHGASDVERFLVELGSPLGLVLQMEEH